MTQTKDAPSKYFLEQKFCKGDLVMVSQEMPSYMSHFRSSGLARVHHSYADAHLGTDTKQYAIVFLKDDQFSAWYPEDLLTRV